jgi:hypothetical protein
MWQKLVLKHTKGGACNFQFAADELAALVAAAEREACAALLENADLGGLAEFPGWQRYTADLLTKVAGAIRARGQA